MEKICILQQNCFKDYANTSFALQRNKKLLYEAILNSNIEYKELISNQHFDYGIEIEFKNAILEDLMSELRKKYHTDELQYGVDWYVKPDETVTQERSFHFGGEVVSPVCLNSKSEWLELKEICDLIKKHQGYINGSCGLHIHFDLGILGNDCEKWTKLLSLWAIYEEVLFKFAIGDQEKLRRTVRIYAAPIRPYVQEALIHGKEIWNHPELAFEKRCAINLRHLHQYFHNEIDHFLTTIEFRIGNGSLNPIIIQNFVRCYYRLVMAVKNNNSILDYYLKKHEDILYDVALPEYQVSEFDMACELSDIIFDSNEEKLYFLKQYTGQLPKDSKQNIKGKKTL